MYPLKKTTIFLLIPMLLAGCDQIFNSAGPKYLKLSLKNTCGESDPACVAAVDEQFDSCHSKHEEHWKRYMASGLEQEDELLKMYSENMFGCILSEDGEPYFFYDPE